MQWAELAQTLQVRVLWPMPNATIHECGLPIFIVAGLEPGLSREHMQKSNASTLDQSATVTHNSSLTNKSWLSNYAKFLNVTDLFAVCRPPWSGQWVRQAAMAFELFKQWIAGLVQYSKNM